MRCHRVDFETETRTLLRGFDQLDFASEELDEAAADGQTETGATEFPSGRRINLTERFEETVNPVCRNSQAGVTNGKSDAFCFAAFVRCEGNTDFDFSLGGELDRVTDEVDEHLSEAGSIGDDPVGNAFVDGMKQLDFLFAGFAP